MKSRWSSHPPPRLSDNPWVTFAFQDSSAERCPILSARKPEFQPCPAPDGVLLPWLADGWSDYRQNVGFKLPENPEPNFGDGTRIQADPVELLAKNHELYSACQSWLEKRETWQKEQYQAQDALELFDKLSNMYTSLQRDEDVLELVAASMFFKKSNDDSVDHPVFLKRVAIQFDAESNIISIGDAVGAIDAPYLYEELLVDLEDADASGIRAEIRDECVHPFDRDIMPSLARRLIHSASSHGQYLEDPRGVLNPDTEVCLYQRYALIVMKKPTGVARTINQALGCIESGMEIPSHLLELVGARQVRNLSMPTDEKSVDQRLAETDGEDHDILLSKVANREQLEIARAIERTSSVLVQGPPGTGKTHTIANLLGHFLAQGKKVLITSSKAKALDVLKEKLPNEIEALCVSAIGGATEDLERSVNAIIDKQSTISIPGLGRAIQRLEEEREAIIEELSSKRHSMYDMRKQEASTFVVNGEELTAIEIAQDVAAMKDRGTDLLIPGAVDRDVDFPYSAAELATLYKKNSELDIAEEALLPQLATSWDSWILPSLSEFKNMADDAKELHRVVEERCEQEGWDLVRGESHYEVVTQWGRCSLPKTLEIQDAQDHIRAIQSLSIKDEWMISAAADGARGHADLWDRLFDLMDETDAASAQCRTETFGHVVSLGNREDYHEIREEAQALLASSNKGKLAVFVSGLFGGGRAGKLAGVTVDGGAPSGGEQLKMVINLASLGELRARCAVVWNQQVESIGGPSFASLDPRNPEHIACKWREDVCPAVHWVENAREKLKQSLCSLGISKLAFPGLDGRLDEAASIKAISDFISGVFDGLAATLLNMRRLDLLDSKREGYIASIKTAPASCEGVAELREALLKYDVAEYEKSCQRLSAIEQKVAVLKERDALLKRIDDVAPNWAAALREKKSPHNTEFPPKDLDEGWRYAQEIGFLSRIQREDDVDLQSSIIELSGRYRKVTAKLAADRAWYALAERLQGNIKLTQALNGWKGTIKQIGKGTGKRVSKLRAIARRQMTQCQEAVPAWVMPLSDAMNMLEPEKNHFDVLIVDEASQADITALPLLYMADKVVIVGDDEQVNPIRVGLESERVEALADMSIAGVIPNANLYSPGSSLYDVVGTTFTRLMLKEHFRCVPDIIEFSNALSYNHKIKPLREFNSTNLIPAVVEYRVKDGHRSETGKKNEAEAIAVADIIEACLGQPEYQDKSFGVIAMLGSEQGRLIEEKISKRFGLGVMQAHKIMCGEPANFQGDERDVIILSLVDSNEKYGPLRKRAEGKDNMLKKSYNVAVSRAKDQLWVVHSLDPEFDLKPGDLRRRLIEHVRDPRALSNALEESSALADSPFEREVAAALRMKGYPIQQQYAVGAYRIDIAIVEGDKRIAIECDGERWHSSDEQILNDMERQAILERLGWSFVRIRGSKYYSDKTQTICDVCDQLETLGIDAEHRVAKGAASSDLLERVMKAIDEIGEAKARPLVGQRLNNTRERTETIAEALCSKGHGDDCVETPSLYRGVQPLLRSDGGDRAVEGAGADSIIKRLSEAGVEFYDKRGKGGCLWVVDAPEVDKVIASVERASGTEFAYKREGGRATHGKAAWLLEKEPRWHG